MKRLLFLIIIGTFCVFDLSYAKVDDDLEQYLTEPSTKFLNPKISFKLSSDFNLTDNYQATKKKSEYKDIDFTSRFYGKFTLNDNLYIRSYLKFQREDPISKSSDISSNKAKNRYFENGAIHIEELNINYKIADFSFKIGKTNLDFGRSWDWKRGIFAYKLAKNYKQTEKLGFGISYKLGDKQKDGAYHFNFFSFIDDNKYLDNSIITKRDLSDNLNNKITTKSGLKSYIASLDINFDFGEKYREQEQLLYQFAYLNHALQNKEISLQNNKDEKSFAFSLKYILPIYHNFAIDAIYEYVKINNVDGNKNISENYNNLSLISKIFNNYNLTLSYNQLSNKEKFANGFDKNISEISFGYKFEETIIFDELLLQAGYKNQRTNYKTSLDKQNAIGLLLRYTKNF